MSHPRPHFESTLRGSKTGERVNYGIETLALTVAGGLVAVLVGALALGAIELLLWPLGLSLGFTFPLAALLVFAGFGAGVAAVGGRDFWNNGDWSR